MSATWQVPDTNPIPALRLVTPAAPIVTWGEAAAFLRIDGTTEQTLVESFIAAARCRKYRSVSIACAVLFWLCLGRWLLYVLP